MSFRALRAILEHEALGQRARFERYAADMLFAIASGTKIDAERSPRFTFHVEEVWKNPFEKKTDEPMTAEEIKAHILQKIEGLLNGSDDACRENQAG